MNSLKPVSGKHNASRAGLTVVEVLLVVVVVVVLGFALSFPMRVAMDHARGTACLNSAKQLTGAWLTYVEDNQGRLLPNPGWVAGVMDWNPNNADNTNTAQLLDKSKSPIAPYLRNKEPHVYRCAADKARRARSYSLNAALDGSSQSGPTVHGLAPNGKTYHGSDGTGTNSPARTIADLDKDRVKFTLERRKPYQEMIFTFVCEHPDSINDGTFVFEPGYAPNSERWVDLPSNNHADNRCSFGFADGHAEMHQWVEVTGDGKTAYPVTMTTNRPWADKPVGTSRDYEWMQARMPYMVK